MSERFSAVGLCSFYWGELMFTTSCVFVSLFCCMLITNTSFYVQDNLVRPNWCQEVQNLYICTPGPCIFLGASPCIVHGPARPDQPVFSPSPYPLSPSLRPVTARHGPTGWPGPVGSLIGPGQIVTQSYIRKDWCFRTHEQWIIVGTQAITVIEMTQMWNHANSSGNVVRCDKVKWPTRCFTSRHS